MKKYILLFSFYIMQCCYAIAQDTYTYDLFGMSSNNTRNHIAPIFDNLCFNKIENNKFEIKAYENKLNNHYFQIQLKEYDKIKEKYIYKGKAIQNAFGYIKIEGDCIIYTSEKLDIYLTNKGYTRDGRMSLPNEENKNYYLDIILYNRLIKDGYKTSNYENCHFRIFIIKNDND